MSAYPLSCPTEEGSSSADCPGPSLGQESQMGFLLGRGSGGTGNINIYIYVYIYIYIYVYIYVYIYMYIYILECKPRINKPWFILLGGENLILKS
jgi:hypothetical protein